MTLRRRALSALPLLALGVLGLQACGGGGSPPPKPPSLDLTIIGGADQNPGPSGGAPIQVKVYQLASTGKFEQADVFALINQEKSTLGEDEIGSESFLVAPGQTVTVLRELKPGVQAIGVAALYRDIDQAKWRASAPVASSGPTKLTLRIGRLAISLASGPVNP